jgi:hypothetical protein
VGHGPSQRNRFLDVKGLNKALEGLVRAPKIRIDALKGRNEALRSVQGVIRPL